MLKLWSCFSISSNKFLELCKVFSSALFCFKRLSNRYKTLLPMAFF
ncbi:hypothetical protein [Campylobacter sp.]|nr:hypothetical protein [Campylobacter sp.]